MVTVRQGADHLQPGGFLGCQHDIHRIAGCDDFSSCAGCSVDLPADVLADAASSFIGELSETSLTNKSRILRRSIFPFAFRGSCAKLIQRAGNIYAGSIRPRLVRISRTVMPSFSRAT